MMQGQGGTLAPAAPAAPATPGAIIDPNLSRFSYEQLRARLQVIRDQRSDLASRRDNLGSSYERATGANKASMGDRLQALDNQIVDYEHQMAAITQEMARKAPARTTLPPTGDRYSGDDVASAVFGTFFATGLLAFIFMRRVFRGGAFRNNRLGNQPQQNAIASSERLDRIENA